MSPKSAVRSIKPVPGRAQNRVKIPHFGPKISRTLHQTGPGEGPFWALPRPLFGQKSSLYQGKCSNLDPYFGPPIDKLAQNRPISRPHSEAIFTYTVVQTGQIPAPKWAQNRGVFVYTPKSGPRPGLGRPRPIWAIYPKSSLYQGIWAYFRGIQALYGPVYRLYIGCIQGYTVYRLYTGCSLHIRVTCRMGREYRLNTGLYTGLQALYTGCI